MEMQKNQLVIKDQLINYHQMGEGKTAIIFLHGWRSSAEAWFGVMSKISHDDYSIYSLDLPGFGGSPAPVKAFSISDYVQVVKEFIAKVGLQQVVLIGHSFGGRVAIKLAVSEAELVAKLILVDSAGIKKEFNGRKKIAKLLKPLFRPAIMQGLRKKIYDKMGAGDYLATPELTQTYLKIISEDLSIFMPEIKAETLLIWGANDEETPVGNAEKIHALIKNSKLEVIKDAGHFSFIDKPDEFTGILKEFIELDPESRA